MKETDQTKVKDAYTLEGELYVRKDLTREERDEINGPMGEAMLIAAAVSQQNIDITQLPEEQRNAMMQQAEEKIDAMSDSIVTQAAVTYVQSEYAAQGRDVDQMQTNYVLQAGLQMLGLAAIAMLAAVLVTFLSSRVAASLGRDLRNKVYRKVLSFSSSEMNHFSTASLIKMCIRDRIRVVYRACMISSFWKRDTYHFVVNPPHLARDLEALKDSTTRVAIGAYRSMRISAM